MNTTLNPALAELSGRTAQRVRHELRRRNVHVVRSTRLTPGMLRITLGGAELQGFYSPGFDDHVKLFFPDPATGEFHLAAAGPGADAAPDAPRPIMRDYTPRHFDAQALTLDIDFALHEAGPATQWALQAKVGDPLVIGGPRGSFLLPTDFDWHLLVGDDTALPAIARRLAELPAGSRALVVAEVDNLECVQTLQTAATLQLQWVFRDAGAAGDAAGLLSALQALAWPAGDFHAWVACETGVAKAVRSYLLAERGAQAKWLKAAGYWRRGSIAVHENIDSE
ncbi:siderophore-interacting protein [Variovorax sp. HJSM1_2]|uniref:siderophore-interacting protein n=1 Tax=Variovorax sp. HJSM1_2 TaxID=3366263 RepID=UPI003BDA6EE2